MSKVDDDLIFIGRLFQSTEPEKEKLVLYKSILVGGTIRLVDPYRQLAFWQNLFIYVGDILLIVLKTTIALL